MMQNRKLRAAIIGCGAMGRNHARVLQQSNRYELIAAADIFPQPLEEMRKVAGSIQLYNDAGEMLKKERPDFVAVVTAVKNHCETTVAALEAGAHVLCEKPLAASLEEADGMLECARKAGRALLVHNEFNASPRTLAALKIVREGGIGRVVSMRGTYKGYFCGGWDLCEGAPHLFALAIQFAGPPRWVASEILTQNRPATEDDIFDGKELRAVNAGWLVGDRIHAMIGFDEGVVMHTEFLGVRTNPHLLVRGTEGSVLVPFAAGVRPGAGEPQSYRCEYPNDPEAKWEPLDCSFAEYARIEDCSTRTIAMSYDHIANWLASKQNGEHPMDAAYGRQALEIIHGTFESHFNGGNRITFPLPQRGHSLERRLGMKSM